ncbi:MAG: hypothetical protein ACK5BX_41150, partial [Bradyrhizobium sp.]
APGLHLPAGFLGAAARADAPAALVEAVNRSRQSEAVAMAEQQAGLVKALRNNQTIEFKFAELSKLNTALLSYSVDAANAALAEMVAVAGRRISEARESLILNAVMMVLALAVALVGLAVVQRRISAAIRSLDAAMRRLADRDYTIELAGRFDVVCYWDGFGIGSDADHRRLLRRIA